MWPIIVFLIGAALAGIGYKRTETANLDTLMFPVLGILAGIALMFIGLAWALLS